MAKENKPAGTYAKPHGVAATAKRDPNNVSAQDTKINDVARRVSVGNPANTDVKTSGIKIRGTGAATKGTMARGPMA